MAEAGPAHTLKLDSPTGRKVVVTTILGSGMAFLDSTVVNVALPKIEADLGGGFATLQWVLDAYLLTLGALVLVGGGLGDALGRKRVYMWGIVGFAVTSVLCGLAPTATTLIFARGVQGVAAALMVPGSLALLSSLFVDKDRGRAIGLWSGLSGVATAIGPFVGGFLVDSSASGWRWVFLVNVPLSLAVLWFARSIPDDSHRTSIRDLDWLAAFLTVAGLALIVTPLIEWQRLPTALALGLLAGGAGVLALFVMVERRRDATQHPPPMMPTGLWSVRSFSVANLITLFVYGALGAMLLLFAVGFQIGLGWSALAAGAAGLPITIVLASLSAKIGGLLPTYGARPLLTIGSGLMALSLWWLSFLPDDANYWTHILPPLLLFAFGLAFMVAPITATALGDIPTAASGVASGVNNAVARIAGLIAVAIVPLLAGLAGTDAASGSTVLDPVRLGFAMCAGLMAAGAVVSWFGFGADTGRTSVVEAH